MRWIVGISLLVLTVVVGVGLYAIDIPQHKYRDWITGKTKDRYYSISNYKDIYLTPVELDEVPPYQEDYVQLWKDFPIRNTMIALPTRHPMFQTVPIVENNGKGIPHLGMIILDPTGREISRIYTLPNTLTQDHSRGQELFKLPYVRSRILNRPINELWVDIFSHQIKVEEKSVDEMIYDLYILHIRSKILPPQTLRYGLIKNGSQAMVELNSDDKDYKVELVLTQNNGSIFSYIIKTEKNRPESMKLRSKYLQSVTLSPIDERLGRLLYTEFKQLSYNSQIDQEGMLYLFSAWTQNPESPDLLKEMISFLERSHKNKKQLKPLYDYSFKRYGKTFTTRDDIEGDEDAEIILQRKIELEQRNLRRAAEENSNKPLPTPELSPDEKMNIYLKKAKEQMGKETDDMRVH